MQDEQTQEHKKLIEAALFAAGKALSTDDIAKAIGVASPGAVSNVLNELISDYEKRDSSLIIVKIGEKYIMSVKEPYANKISELAGPPELSRGALRILAYVSKNEPVMQSNVVKTYGSSSYDYLKELSEKDFISAQKTGRTRKLQTTQKFKEYFNF